MASAWLRRDHLVVTAPWKKMTGHPRAGRRGARESGPGSAPALLRPGAHQAIQIARLELVGVPRQRLEIADAVVAGARPEDDRGR